jgi:hypothetical protein
LLNKKFKEIIFTRANLTGAILIEANLSGADLSGADLSGANLSGANLSRADLRKMNLVTVNLSGANLSFADLVAADLSGANLSVTNLTEVDLSEADLRGANLSGANLSGANLSFANLIGADLTGVIEATFSDDILNSRNEDKYKKSISSILYLLENTSDEQKKMMFGINSENPEEPSKISEFLGKNIAVISGQGNPGLKEFFNKINQSEQLLRSKFTIKQEATPSTSSSPVSANVAGPENKKART